MQGGLGFKKFYDINTALLAKMGWKIASEEISLCLNVLQGKYLKGSSYFRYIPMFNDSVV